VGPDPAAALHITVLVERCARITWGARTLGRLHPLPEEVNDRFAGYYTARRQEPF
jgi:ribulose-5-phosphate 4-epimerase/fuculose-1-phosphate aldolase